MAINLSGKPRHHIRIMDLADNRVVYESKDAVEWWVNEANVKVYLGNLKTDVVYLKPGWIVELRETKIP